MPARAPDAMPIDYTVDWSRFEKIEDEPDDAEELVESSKSAMIRQQAANESMLGAVYAAETREDARIDKLSEIKIRMAMDAYEKRRKPDQIMHHYLVREAGDPAAVGEYFPTGEERGGVPVYKNQNDLVLSREQLPLEETGGEAQFMWVIGDFENRQALYFVQSEDLSVPTLGWQTYTAPEPVPTVRYFSQVAASRRFKERGSKAFQARDWSAAEVWYTKALTCKMDPVEYAEPFGIILSNRAEVRLRMYNFEGAATDAEHALKHLKLVQKASEQVVLLRQKTIVRRAKALQALRRHLDASKVLVDARADYPGNAEILRLLEECNFALKGADSRAKQGKGGSATEDMLNFVAGAADAVQEQLRGLGEGLGDAAFPAELLKSLKRLETILDRARAVEGNCLADLQTLLRTNGTVRVLAQVLMEQWKENVDGRLADTFKLRGLAGALGVLAAACQDNVENLRIAVAEAPAVFGALGGCSRKVEAEFCEKLVFFAASLWEHCKLRTLELVQEHSFVVERAAAFLAKVLLAEFAGEAGDETAVPAGADAPQVGGECRERALGLLLEFLDFGGRVERRALRGVAPLLADAQGEGFFTNPRDEVHELGRLVCQKAQEDPATLAPREVITYLRGVGALILSGPVSDGTEDVVNVTFGGGVAHYVDLDGWEFTPDGKHAALMLDTVARSLEWRLVDKIREVGREGYEDAVYDSLLVLAPLVTAPEPLARPALLCLAALAQGDARNVDDIVSLGTVHALMGLPCPAHRPVASCVGQVLRASAGARRHAAKLLSRCADTEVVLNLLRNAGEQCIGELVTLAIEVYGDGKASLEAFHDMLHVFYVVAMNRPGPLCKYLPVDAMRMLVSIANYRDDSRPATYAAGVVQTLLRDKACKKVLLPIVQQAEEENLSYDHTPEDELKLHKTMTPLMGQID